MADRRDRRRRGRRGRCRAGCRLRRRGRAHRQLPRSRRCGAGSQQADVQRNLQLLTRRSPRPTTGCARTVGQGGPNFIQNAILGPLKDKRFATINRIETAIGRNAAKPNLNAEGLSACTLNKGSGGSAAQPTAVPPPAAGGGGGRCADRQLPGPEAHRGDPAQQQADVQRNFDLLETQIAEANNRLRTTVGQGGPNFIQNAILGPLKDKRFATINRIETAIGRNAAKPNLNAEGLSACTLNQGGEPEADRGTDRRAEHSPRRPRPGTPRPVRRSRSTGNSASAACNCATRPAPRSSCAA